MMRGEGPTILIVQLVSRSLWGTMGVSRVILLEIGAGLSGAAWSRAGGGVVLEWRFALTI
jgi:hypothetical protein